MALAADHLGADHGYRAGRPDGRGTPVFQRLRDAQDRMLAHYRGKEWDQAEAALGECRGLAPEFLQGLYDLYAARIAAYRADPSPGDRDGVYEARTKAG